MFKQSLSNSAEKKEATPVKRKSQEDIPVEMEDSDEEYQEDEFDDSQGSEALAKVSVSQSGRLPPLSGSYPHGTNDKTMSATFLKSSKEARNFQSPEEKVEKNEQLGLGGSPTVKNIVHGDQRAETTNLNNRIVKEGQKGGRNYNSTISGLGGSSFGNIEDSAASIDFNLSESRFPGLENTMQSPKDDEIKRTATGPMGSVVSHGSSLKQTAGSRQKHATTLINKVISGSVDESALSMDKDDFELSESNFDITLASNAQRKASGVSLVNNPPFTGSALRDRATTQVVAKSAKPAVVAEDDDDDNYDDDFE